MQDTSIISSERLDNILLFHKIDGPLQKSERRGPKGYEAFRYIASAEIIDLEGEIISLQAIAEVKPIMIKQGARTQYNHMNFPTGYFFDWGFTKTEGIDAIWIDVEVYDDYPNQKDVLRRIKLPKEDPESLTCISLGGFKLEKEKECGDLTCWTRITKIEGWEYSHVHQGANQLALKIEEQLDYMEFESLNNEQPRDSNGQFVSEVTETTITKYSDSKNMTSVVKNTPCDKVNKMGDEHPDMHDIRKMHDHCKEQGNSKLNKMCKMGDMYKMGEKPKPKENESYEEDMDQESEDELEEEVIESAEEEQASEDLAGEEETMGDEMMEEGLEDPMDQINDREIAVDTNERVKVMMAAMNIDKVLEEEFIEDYKALEDKYLKKREQEMTEEMTINGNVYVLKTEPDEPKIEKSEPEKTETVTYTKEEVNALVAKELKKELKTFGEGIAKEAPKEEVIETENTQNPNQHDESEKQSESGIFNKGMSVEERMNAIGSLKKTKPLTVFVQ